MNLSLLFYYKYHVFVLNSLNKITGGTFRFEDLILPLGISFFTFTQITYLVDIYKGNTKKSDFVSYGLFVTVFPHLLAGPILHHKPLMQQLNDEKNYQWSILNIANGIFLFTIGLFKKVMVADLLAQIANPVFDGNVSGIAFTPSWIAAFAYTFQLYFDFSGYSDMAVGLGLLFNLNFPVNFNSPYKADSIIDFWRRWHISLSTFLKDYIYIPLGGSRLGTANKIRNIMITMVLGGIWHGAGTTFLIWGFLQGVFLSINHLWRHFNLKMPIILARCLTILAIVAGWVFFRSSSMMNALRFIKGMAGLNGLKGDVAWMETVSRSNAWQALKVFIPFSSEIIVIVCLGCIVFLIPNSNEIQQKFCAKPVRWAVLCSLLLFISLLHLDQISEFIYYRF